MKQKAKINWGLMKIYKSVHNLFYLAFGIVADRVPREELKTNLYLYI